MISLLAIADAHIGRYPSRVPRDQKEYSISEVWMESIDYAIEHGVHAVVLAGDIIDTANRYFEAFGPLRRGVTKLTNAGIPVFAVAGNHDYNVLPRLADDMGRERFCLLGRGGKWETVPLQVDSQVVAQIVGWSFPSEECRTSPLDTFPGVSSEEPLIGLIHGDLDARDSHYAPLALPDLQRQSVAVWILGHIHTSRYVATGGVPVLYPGSLQALDPGEPSDHGPWLVEIDAGGHVEAKQLPIATVRYVTLIIDLTDVSSESEAQSLITEKVTLDSDRLSQNYPSLRHASYRLTLVGATPAHRALSLTDWANIGYLDIEHGDLQTSVDRVFVETVPARNLKDIARLSDPPAMVAGWVLELDNMQEDLDLSPDCQDLLQQATEEANKVISQSRYRQLQGTSIHSSDVARLLVSKGRLLVDTLMAQKDDSHE